MEASGGMRTPRLYANLLGWLSLLCALPFLVLLLGGLPHPPDTLIPTAIWATILSPLAGALFALIAARASRWWLALTVAWAVMISLEWTSLSHVEW